MTRYFVSIKMFFYSTAPSAFSISHKTCLNILSLNTTKIKKSLTKKKRKKKEHILCIELCIPDTEQ